VALYFTISSKSSQSSQLILRIAHDNLSFDDHRSFPPVWKKRIKEEKCLLTGRFTITTNAPVWKGLDSQLGVWAGNGLKKAGWNVRLLMRWALWLASLLLFLAS